MYTSTMAVLAKVLAALSLIGAGEGIGDKVYYGKTAGAKKPATCTATTVFRCIPEYQEIISKGLKQDDPAYWVLLAKANEKFYKAVEVAAKAGGNDCVVETGSAAFDNPPTDLTQGIIGSLK